MRELETKKETDQSIAERWRNERWAWIESNEPYGVKYSKEAAMARAAAKEEFLTDESLDEPRITYPDIDIDEVNDAILRYDTMLFEMRTHQRGAEGEKLYNQIARKIAELIRLRYTYQSQITNDLVHRQALRSREVELSHALFGEPDRDSVAYAVDSLRDKAALNDTSIGRELEALLPSGHEAGRVPQLLAQETIDVVAPIIDDIFAPALAVIDRYEDDPQRSPDAAAKMIQEMIDAMGFEGARVILTEGGALETSGGQFAIELGRKRKPVTNHVMGTVVLHELTHLWGYYSTRIADQNSIQGVGMPDTLGSEEGKAGCVEQLRKREATDRGEAYTLACGLFEGTLDGKKHTFREVHEIMWRRILVESGATTDTAIAAAKATAYGSVMRVWRGGALDTRDLSYGVGNLVASQAFNRVPDMAPGKRRSYVEFILSHRVNYLDPEEMKLMGWVD